MPRRNDDLARVRKLPAGPDGFFNEIHPMLRPMETVIDGVLIAGAVPNDDFNGAQPYSSAVSRC